jgi:hypothetical protein
MRAKRGRGRPPLAAGVRSIEVTASVIEPDFHALQAIASADRMSVAAVIRVAVRHLIRLRRRALVVPLSPRRSRSVQRPGTL